MSGRRLRYRVLASRNRLRCIKESLQQIFPELRRVWPVARPVFSHLAAANRQAEAGRER